MPTVREKLKTLYNKLKHSEPLTLRDYLFDEGKEKTLVDSLLVGSDDNGNGVVPIIATVNDISESAENNNILAL